MPLRRGFLLISLVSVLFRAGPAYSQEPKTPETKKLKILTFGYDNVSQAPWLSSEQQSYVIQILKTVDDELVEVDFKLIGMPWKRCLQELSTGHIDGCFSAAHSKERAEKGLFPTDAHGQLDSSRRLLRTHYSLMVPLAMKELLKIKGLRIEGWNMKLKIGVNEGYTIYNDLEPLGYSLEKAPSLEQNKMKLMNGRIMGLVDLRTRLEKLKASPDMQTYVIMPESLIEKDFFLMLSHQLHESDSVLSEKIWSKIGEVRSRREFADPLR